MKYIIRRVLENKAADALSRKCGNEEICNAISVVVPEWMHQISSSYKDDHYFPRILEAKVMDPSTYPEFELKGDILRYKADLPLEQALLSGQLYLKSYTIHLMEVILGLLVPI